MQLCSAIPHYPHHTMPTFATPSPSLPPHTLPFPLCPLCPHHNFELLALNLGGRKEHLPFTPLSHDSMYPTSQRHVFPLWPSACNTPLTALPPTTTCPPPPHFWDRFGTGFTSVPGPLYLYPLTSPCTPFLPCPLQTTLMKLAPAVWPDGQFTTHLAGQVPRHLLCLPTCHTFITPLPVCLYTCVVVACIYLTGRLGWSLYPTTLPHPSPSPCYHLQPACHTTLAVDSPPPSPSSPFTMGCLCPLPCPLPTCRLSLLCCLHDPTFPSLHPVRMVWFPSVSLPSCLPHHTVPHPHSAPKTRTDRPQAGFFSTLPPFSSTSP